MSRFTDRKKEEEKKKRQPSAAKVFMLGQDLTAAVKQDVKNAGNSSASSPAKNVGNRLNAAPAKKAESGLAQAGKSGAENRTAQTQNKSGKQAAGLGKDSGGNKNSILHANTKKNGDLLFPGRDLTAPVTSAAKENSKGKTGEKAAGKQNVYAENAFSRRNLTVPVTLAAQKDSRKRIGKQNLYSDQERAAFLSEKKENIESHLEPLQEEWNRNIPEHIRKQAAVFSDKKKNAEFHLASLQEEWNHNIPKHVRKQAEELVKTDLEKQKGERVKRNARIFPNRDLTAPTRIVVKDKNGAFFALPRQEFHSASDLPRAKTPGEKALEFFGRSLDDAEMERIRKENEEVAAQNRALLQTDSTKVSDMAVKWTDEPLHEKDYDAKVSEHINKSYAAHAQKAAQKVSISMRLSGNSLPFAMRQNKEDISFLNGHMGELVEKEILYDALKNTHADYEQQEKAFLKANPGLVQRVERGLANNEDLEKYNKYVQIIKGKSRSRDERATLGAEIELDKIVEKRDKITKKTQERADFAEQAAKGEMLLRNADNSVTNIAFMTEEEKQVAYALYAEDSKKADAYGKMFHERADRKTAEFAEKFGEEHPVGAFIGSAVSFLPKAVAGAAYTVQNAANAFAGKDAVNPALTPYMRIYTADEAMRKGIHDRLPDWGDFLVDAGLSITDSIQAAALNKVVPHLGTAMLSLSAAGSAGRSAYFRGGNAGQVALSAVGIGAIEYLTENISLSNLEDILKVSGKQKGVAVLKDMLRAAPSDSNLTKGFKILLHSMASQFKEEAREELISEYAGLFWDCFVMGENAEINLSRKEYMEKDGLSEAEASKAVFLDYWVKAPAASYFMGGFTGGIMGGGAALLNIGNAFYGFSNGGRVTSDGSAAGKLSMRLLTVDKARRLLEQNAFFAEGIPETGRTNKVKNGKYYIDVDANGDKVTVITENQGLFAGLDEKNVAHAAKDFMFERYKDKTLPLSQYGLVYVNKTGINKYLHSTNDASTRVEKMKAVGEFESLLENAEFIGHKKDAKAHKFAEFGFDYYKTVFAVGGQVFEGIIDIGVSSDGATFYGMSHIKRVTGDNGKYFGLLSRYADANAENKKRVTGADGKYFGPLPSYTSVLSGNSLDINIPQNGADVNNYFMQNREKDSGKQQFISNKQGKNFSEKQISDFVERHNRRAKAAWAIARAFDVNVQFGGLDNPKAAGQFDKSTNTLFLRPDISLNEFAALAEGHEIVHAIEDTKAYKKFAELVLKEAYGGTETERFKQALSEVKTWYAENGVMLSDKGAVQELVAEFMRQNHFGSSQQILTFISENYQSLGKTFFQKIGNIAEKMKGILGKDAKPDSQKILEQFAAAMKQRRRTQAMTDLAEGYGILKSGSDTNQQFLIKRDKFGKVYWDVETGKDIFKGITDRKELQKTVYQFILKGDKGKTVEHIIDGKPLSFTRIGAKEYLYGRAGKQLNETHYNQKLRLAPSILDLIENAAVQYKTPDHKSHKFAKDGFENYRGRVGIDDVIFNYVVRVGKNSGRNLFYDINLEAEQVTLPGAFKKSTSGIQKRSASDTNIPQKETGVKNYSMQGVEKDSKRQQFVPEKNSGGSQYFIEYTKENRPVVHITEDFLKGLDMADWVPATKKVLAAFRPSISVAGKNIYLNSKAVLEYTHSGYSRLIAATDPELYRNKLLAAGNLDEMILASTDFKREDLKHARKDSVTHFARGNVLMQIGDNKYSASLMIAHKKDGSLLMYDLVDLQPADFQIRKKAGDKADLQKAGSGRQQFVPEHQEKKRRGENQAMTDLAQSYGILNTNKAAVDENTISSFCFTEKGANTRELVEILKDNLSDLYTEDRIFNIRNSDIVHGKNASETVYNYFKKIGGTAQSPIFGTVELTKSGAKATVFHGVGKEKITAVAGIKDVIEKGKIINQETNWKNRGYDTYVVAGKGLVNGRESILGVVIKAYPNTKLNNKFYVHEIIKIGIAPDAATENSLTYVNEATPNNTNIPQKETGVKNYSMQNAENDSGYAHKKSSLATGANANSLAFTSETTGGTSTDNRLSQEKPIVNTKDTRNVGNDSKRQQFVPKHQEKKRRGENQVMTDLAQSYGILHADTHPKTKNAEQVQYAFLGKTRDGKSVYVSDFDASVPMNQRIGEFKKRISSIFNLGAVQLDTGKKKIRVLGDRFTQQKNLYGDKGASRSEYNAKINALYDLVDILENSTYVGRNILDETEPSYITGEKPKNGAHEGVQFWYKFKNEIIFDNVPYDVIFNVRDKGGTQYGYLIEFHNKEAKPSNTVSKGNLLRDGLTSDTNIPQKETGVKNYSMQGVEKDSKRQQFVPEKNSGGSQYFIEYTKENRPVVHITEDFLKGLDMADWVPATKKVLAAFRPSISVAGKNIYLNSKAVLEYTHSGYSRLIAATDPELYRNKLLAAGNLDEMILASTDFQREELKHERKDSVTHFARGNVLMQIGDNKYSASLMIAHKKDGSFLMYDLVDLQPADFQIQKKAGDKADLQKAGSGRQSMIPFDTEEIYPGMEDSLRAEVLKNKSILIVPAENKGDFSSLKGEAAKRKLSALKKDIKQMMVEKGFFKRYPNAELQMEVEYSGRALNETMHKNSYNTREDLLHLLDNFEEVFREAKVIDATKKYAGTEKANPELQAAYTLLSAFRNGEGIVVPCQFTVKAYKPSAKETTKIYMGIALTKISDDSFVAVPLNHGGSTAVAPLSSDIADDSLVTLQPNKSLGTNATPSSDIADDSFAALELNFRSAANAPLSSDRISLPQFIQNVNAVDARFLKHIPDGLLTSAQRAAAQNARLEDEKRISQMQEKNAEFGSKRQQYVPEEVYLAQYGRAGEKREEAVSLKNALAPPLVQKDGVQYMMYDFKKQVDDALDNRLKSGLSVYVGKTPNILAKCGLDADLPVLINQGHLRDMNQPKNNVQQKFHGLPRETMKHIPQMLKNPVMVYDSISSNKENVICVVTSETDSDGLPIILAVKNSGENNKYLNVSFENVDIDRSNYILSMYGKDGFFNHVRDIIDKDAVLYISRDGLHKLFKRKSLKWNAGSKLQLLTLLDHLGFDNIIHKSRNIVNNYSMQNVKKDSKNRQYFIEYTKENRPVVHITEDFLKGLDMADWVPATKKVLAAFRPSVSVAGRDFQVNTKAVQEYTRSGYSRLIAATDPALYRNKLLAAGNLDEMILASTNFVNEGLNHERKDSVTQFARGNVLMQIGDNKYSATLMIAYKKDNTLLMYDLVDLQPADFQIQKKAGDKADLQKAGSGRR